MKKKILLLVILVLIFINSITIFNSVEGQLKDKEIFYTTQAMGVSLRWDFYTPTTYGIVSSPIFAD